MKKREEGQSHSAEMRDERGRELGYHPPPPPPAPPHPLARALENLHDHMSSELVGGGDRFEWRQIFEKIIIILIVMRRDDPSVLNTPPHPHPPPLLSRGLNHDMNVWTLLDSTYFYAAAAMLPAPHPHHSTPPYSQPNTPLTSRHSGSRANSRRLLQNDSTRRLISRTL